MENKRIVTSELDFDGIKRSFKTFLEGQEKFSDYNFEGSGLSVLLDVLAYNTHYNALYTNLAINEAFIDSASKRNSVVSKAKALGYTPRSYKCSTTKVNLSIVTPFISSNTVLDLPKYTVFSGTGETTSYRFYTTEHHLLTKSADGRVFSKRNIEVKEGKPLQYSYIVSDNTEYIIPNEKVDLDTIKVRVQETLSSSTFDTYIPTSSLINLNADSMVYFVKEIDNGKYQIEFGDNIIGKKPTNGNVVVIEYMVCNGHLPNGISALTYNGPTFISGQKPLVTLLSSTHGGSIFEDIESIRFIAPHYYSAQNRLVTVQDYKTLISAAVPTKAINVWGGEDHIPKIFGNVYVSIVPADGGLLTSVEKEFIKNSVIKSRTMMSTHTIFVDPAYIKINLTVDYHYDPNKTQLKSNDISQIIRTNLLKYSSRDLMQFNTIFRHSYVTNLIDKSDSSILNSSVKAKLVYETRAYINQATRYEIYLDNPIFNTGVAAEHVKSDPIYVSDLPTVACFIDDNPIDADTGVLRLVSFQNLQKVVFRNIGRINYNTGALMIYDLKILQSTSSNLKFTITPASADIASFRNHILLIDPAQLTMTAINNRDTSTYKFTGII